MEHKAYSIISEKSYTEDDDFVYIKGIASTPTPDRVQDVLKPLGAKFKLPMPLLMHHQHTQVVGSLTKVNATKKGIDFEARIPKVKEEGIVRDRTNEAIHSLKYHLLNAFSVGFRPVEGKYKYLQSGGIEFDEWDWYENSLVTVPMNPEAVLSAAKSLSHEAILAAMGRATPIDKPVHKGAPARKTGSVKLSTPGATGKQNTAALPRGAVKLIS